MRERNRVVFYMVSAEEEYVECLSTLVSGFLRPCKMAASSKHQAITHEEVNSIFLNRYFSTPSRQKPVQSQKK